MSTIHRILSRPVNKPYRSKHVDQEPPYLNEKGYVDFAPGSIENPHNWSTPRRWSVTVCAVLLVMNATFASSAPSGCFPSISETFDISEEVAGLTITLFLLGYVAGPLLFAPLSEVYGRRWVFYITFSCYIAFNFLCAFAPNLPALLIGRFLTGFFVAAPLSNAPGVLADLWDPIERGNGMACFSCMVTAGPALGPVVAGFLELKKDWRWSFYVLLWLGAGTAVLMLTIPETYGPQILQSKAKRIRAAGIPGYENVKAAVEDSDRSLASVYKLALTRPWIILLDPISFLVAIYMSVVYLLLYMLFSIYPIVFQEKRGWNAGVGELPLLGAIVGAILGGLIVVIDTHMRAKKVRTGKATLADFEPEDRLPLAMIGGIGFAGSMFWFAWTANYNWIHWIVPTLAGTVLIGSMLLLFISYLNYLVDTYLMYAASAIAANTICRSAVGAAAPLFTNQMFSALGVGGGGSLIGGVATLLAFIPFAFYKYGKQIRVKSKFAPTSHSKPERETEEREDNPTVFSISSREGENVESSSTALASSSSSEKAAEEGRANEGVLGRTDVLHPASTQDKLGGEPAKPSTPAAVKDL